MNKTQKFWNWKVKNQGEDVESRTLILDGVIAGESWFDDDITPQMFFDELHAGNGDIEVFINSPGGDCVAASQIYTMLNEYKGNVTIKIDGLAASAASVVAMAGNKTLMSPTSIMMIHNPFTYAEGDVEEFEKAIAMLEEVKESIINAYELKSGLSRAKISHLMDAETWLNAGKALELGFIDGVMTTKNETKTPDEDEEDETDEITETAEDPESDEDDDDEDEKENLKKSSFSFSEKSSTASLVTKVAAKYKPNKSVGKKIYADDLQERLNSLSH